MKNRDYLKTAIDLVENDTCIVFHACEADKFKGDKQKTDHRFLLLTNINVIFLKIGSKPKQLSSEFWADLVGIDGLLGQDQIITLYFKQDTYKFKIGDSQEIKTIKLKLGDLFQRIFTIEEQEMLGLSKSDLYQISCRSIPNSFGQYSRFLSYVKSNRVEIEKDTQRRFLKYLVYLQKEISFPKKIKSNEFESFMYGLDSLQFIESILFKEISSVDIFQQLTSFYSTLFENPSIYMKNNKENEQKNYQFKIRDNIRHFKFKKIKSLNKFDEFIYYLANGQIEHNLIGLSFENMKFIEKNFYSIDKLCRSKKADKSMGLRSLSFDSSLNEDHYNYFLSSFLNKDTTRHLCMLSLNNTFNLSMPLLLDKIRNISSLSLADCNINIVTTLQCIDRARMDNLRMLNLSGNYCSKMAPPEFDGKKKKKEKKKKKDLNYNGEEYNPNDDVEFDDDDIVFPQSLNILYVRNCKWGSRFRPLIAFLKAASSFKPKTTNNNSQFRLSMRGIRGGSFDHEGEYNASFNYFGEFNSYLAGFFTDVKRSYITHLDWAGNPVSSEFIDFIRKSKRLVELDLSYCFSAEFEGDNSDMSHSKSEQKNQHSNTLLRQFSRYLVNDAKKLESLIICGRQKVTKEDDKKREPNKTLLSQNLSGNSIFPLFQAIKETKNPLSYINISGQRLENPAGLNFFSEAVGCNQNIEKVSFKNTGFETKEQFNYFVSKVKRSKPILVEWPSEEMKIIGENNIAHFKKLLIQLSKHNFYYEGKVKRNSIDSEKPSKKKNKKSHVDSDSDSGSYSDDFVINDDTEIKFDKLLFGKNRMARKIEAFQFDTDRNFPSYFSKEVEEFLSLPQEKYDDVDDDKDSDDEKKKKNKKKTSKFDGDDDKNNNSEETKTNNKKKNKKSKKKNPSDSDDNDDESEEEDDDDDKSKKNKKKKKQTKKVKKVESDSEENDDDESEEDDDEDDKSKKKKPKPKKKPIKKPIKAKNDDTDDNDDEEEGDDDEDDAYLLKSKKKFLIAKNKKKAANSDDDDDDENDKIRSKKKVKRKGISISSSDSDGNDDDSEGEDGSNDDDGNSEKWKFPKGIRPNKDGKKLIRNIKDKFSMENLMTNLVNGSE